MRPSKQLIRQIKELIEDPRADCMHIDCDECPAYGEGEACDHSFFVDEEDRERNYPEAKRKWFKEWLRSNTVGQLDLF